MNNKLKELWKGFAPSCKHFFRKTVHQRQQSFAVNYSHCVLLKNCLEKGTGRGRSGEEQLEPVLYSAV